VLGAKPRYADWERKFQGAKVRGNVIRVIHYKHYKRD